MLKATCRTREQRGWRTGHILYMSKPTAIHKTSYWTEQHRLFLLALKKAWKTLHPLNSTKAGFHHLHHDLLCQILHTSSPPLLASVKSLGFYTSGVSPDFAQVLILQQEGEVASCLGRAVLPCWTQYPFPHNTGTAEGTTDRLGAQWQQFPATSTETEWEICSVVIHFAVLSGLQTEQRLLPLPVTPLTQTVEVSTLQTFLISRKF